jgi:hypothetical protein
MFSRRVLLFAALAICGSRAAAWPVQVAVDWPTSTPASARASVRIQAVRAAVAIDSGQTDNGVPVQTKAAPDGLVLDLSEGVWQLQASAPGYWSQGAEVTVAGQAPASVRLAFWPAASLHGQIVTAGGEPLPAALEVRLSATPASAGEITNPHAPIVRPDPGPSRAELHCRIDAGTWSCLGPAGLFDVRLEAAGYAPRYEWSTNLKPAQSADFGRTELLRSASVFGRAVGKNGSDPPGPCRATLQASMERHGPTAPDQEPASAPTAETSFSVALSRRGYFQVVGVTPGKYALSVDCQAASGFQELRVRADSETRVEPPLLLEELTLDIAVMPKAGPDGQPWKLAVYATAPHFRLIADGATTSADGRWVRRGLTAGNYRIVISSSDGTAWLERYFDLGEGSGPLLLRLGSVSVAGRVKLNSRPVRAQLVFSNNAGGESATLTSDSNGHFQGVLPMAPGAQESSWTVVAHVAQPPVTQRLLGVSVQPAGGGASAWLDLELPAIPVRGSVVSPDGQPQPNVQVTVEDSSGARTTTSTDNAGRFEMLDLPPGKYTAVAESRDGTSDRRPFEVAEGGGSELKLVLNPFKRYYFYIVSSQGAVADAAVQLWIAPGVPRAFGRTDENGRFEVTLPPGTTEVGMTIGAPGYAIKLTRLAIPSDSEDDGPSSANTITLDASGGTLVLNFHPPGRPLDNSAMLYLVHNGAIQDARTIASWGTDQAGVGGNASGDVPAVVDAIEPGNYSLCILSDPAELAALWQGPLPSNLCRTGSLEDGSTLTLSPR